MDLRTLSETPPWEWPEGTGERLLAVLRDDRAGEADLRLAAELAGDITVVNDEMVAALLSILQRNDQAEPVRCRAAISLGPVLEVADDEGFEDPEDVPITEGAFQGIQRSLHQLFADPEVPKEVRRRVLEASVRAPQDWHQGAIAAAYQSDDEAWRLTAVFCMRFVRGFEAQILEALDSEDPEIHSEAVQAAGSWGLDAAWPHVAALVASGGTDKPLLLAAIDAAASIRPEEAPELLGDLADSDDEEIVEAVDEALAMAGTLWDDGSGDEDDGDDLIH
jgi:hypothetical protein